MNVLIGPNGAGKTNVLEAIGYVGMLRSFRGAVDEALVANDADRAYLRAGVDQDGRQRLVELELVGRGPRRAQLDGQRLRRAADLIEVLRTVAFLPEDLELVKGGPTHRRQFLDEVAVQLWPSAFLDQQEFDRALRQRNAFLRQGATDVVTLGVWDERVSQAGGKVMARRGQTMTHLAPEMVAAYRRISGGTATLELRYGSEWGADPDPTIPAAVHSARLSAVLGERRRVDSDRRLTTAGPHRDDPGLMLDESQVRTHASQGEQRSSVLALRLAAHRAVASHTGVSPVLLLDDVFSELDSERSEALASTLPVAQTFVTSARPDDVPVAGRRWQVSAGTIE